MHSYRAGLSAMHAEFFVKDSLAVWKYKVSTSLQTKYQGTVKLLSETMDKSSRRIAYTYGLS